MYLLLKMLVYVLGLFQVILILVLAWPPAVLQLSQTQEGSVLLQILDGLGQLVVDVLDKVDLVRRRRRRQILWPQEILRHIVLGLGRYVGVREATSLFVTVEYVADREGVFVVAVAASGCGGGGPVSRRRWDVVLRRRFKNVLKGILGSTRRWR